MFSSITERGATVTLDALMLGANDYVTKPSNLKNKEAALKYIQAQLIPKIKIFSAKKVGTSLLTPLKSSPKISPLKSIIKPTQKVEVIAIGVSTGGPDALSTLLSAIPANFPLPIVIVQHMPPIFTKRLAQRLNSHCQITIQEAKSGDILQPGKAWIAPGDYHMFIEREGTHICIRTNQNPPENSCRPAVDVLFRSVAQVYQEGVLAVVLTGMGQDGLHGCEYIHEAGGQILVQDENSSVVWGMPGIVAHAGLASKILPLNQIADEIMKRANHSDILLR